MRNQHILYTSICPPQQGPGSPIIIDRHLRKLSGDWKITIVAPQLSFNGIEFPNSWQLIQIPSRRWWWLPYRPHSPQLRLIRFWYWQRECERIFQQERPTVILTVLKDIYSIFSAYLARAWGIPLHVILHDQEEIWETKRGEKYGLIKQNGLSVLNQATKIWTVSEELGNAYPLRNPAKISTLFPIPEGRKQGFIEWRQQFSDAPVLAYAGSIYPSQIDHLQKIAFALEKINGTLLLVVARDRPGVSELIASCPNVEYQPPFSKNADAINFLATKASCLLVPYPFDLAEHPWAITCFPSKLVEFSHLGLPILVLAPSDTSLGNWAIQQAWKCYLDCMDEAKLLLILQQLSSQKTWIEMAQQSQAVACEPFNPAHIQAQFESELVVASKAR